MTLDATTIIDYTYENFKEGIGEIARQILHSNFEPDLLVGLVRGGAVPAAYLSHKLKIPVEMIRWSFRDAVDRTSNCWIPEDINNGIKVLVVDDIVDGGKTIETLLQDWQSNVREPLKLENIKIAALWYNTAQPIAVDFFHQTINRDEDNRWVVFDWEA